MDEVNVFKCRIRSETTPEEEEISRKLFEYIDNSELKNGDKVELTKVINYIFEKLKGRVDKKRIEQHVKRVLQDDKCMHRLDENGNIEVRYSRLHMLQKEFDIETSAKAEETLKSFVQKVKRCALQLDERNEKVTHISLKWQFEINELEGLNGTERLRAEMGLERNKVWITLAIEEVLKEIEQEQGR